MRSRILILLFLVFSYLTCFSQNIVQAEYFIDTDYGFGNNVPITLDSITADGTFQFNINLTEEEQGVHTLYIRAKDEYNIWSLSSTKTFVVNPVNIDSSIRYGEYYFDTDPGLGNAIPINIPTLSKDTTISYLADLSSLSTGVHIMYLRFKDDVNQWSTIGKTPIIVQNNEKSEVEYAEYFFDKDPGLNNGLSVSLSNTTLDSTISFIADLSGLKSGIHNMYFRTRNTDGEWSVISTNYIYVQESTPSLATEIEYFFDKDPGFGKGYKINAGAGSLDTTITFSPNLDLLKEGIHSLYIRSKNNNGEWSTISNTKISLYDKEATPIVRVYYYYSSGTEVTDTFYYDVPNPAKDVSEKFAADLSQLNEYKQYHINAWATDSIGKKSLVSNILTTYDPLYCEAGFDFVLDEQRLSAQFADTSFGVSTGIYWEFGDEEFSNEKNPTHVYGEPGIYEVCLSIFNSETKCFSKKCTKISLGSADTTSCYAGFTNTISNLTASFTAGFSSDITANYWEFGDGSFAYSQNPSHTYNKPGEYRVCANVFNKITGCQSVKCKNIRVGIADCEADFNIVINRLDKKVDLINNSKGDIKQYYWDLGDGTAMYKESGTKTYNAFGQYEVCLSVFNEATNCYSEKCKKVDLRDTSQNSHCNNRFTYIVSSTTREVIFRENSLANFDKWYWDFGDGDFANTKTTSHTYQQDGVYNICLTTLHEKSGCKAELCKQITVTESSIPSQPLLNAEYSHLADSVSLGVLFKDFTTGTATNWYWTFGDGTFSKEQNPTKHIYNSAGIYNVCLTVFNENSGATSNICKDIVVGTQSCNVIANFTSFIDVANKQVRFTDQSKGNIEKWFWNFGDGNTSTQRNPSHSYAKTGYYLVSLSVRNVNGGCNDYYANFIQVGSSDCKANFSYLVDADSNKVVLNSTSKGDIAKYFWVFNDGNYDTGMSTKHYYDEPGIYNIGLTIGTSGGTCSDYAIEQVQVGEAKCNAEFKSYIDSSSNTAYFTNQALNSSTIVLWQFGDGAISTEKDPSHTYTRPGYFTVGLNTYNPLSNCMDYTEEVLLIGQSGNDCEANFLYQVDGKKVDFYDNSLGENLSHYWWFGDGATMSKKADTSVTYTEGGYYLVCLTVISQGGIQNTRCKFVGVDPPAGKKCLTDFNYTVDPNTNTVTFNDNSLGKTDKWLWRFGDKQVSSEENPEHTYTQSGYYKVRLVSGNTETGCISRAWKMVNVGESEIMKAGIGYEKEDLNYKTGGYPVDFVSVSSGKPAKYSWDFGDGNTNTTNIAPTHEYDKPGEYLVCLTVEDQVTEQSDQECETVLIAEKTGIDNDILNQNDLFDISCSPNPFTSFTTINYNVANMSNINISVYDESGRLITKLVNTVKEKGTHKLLWNTSTITSGLYYIQLQSNNIIIKSKLIVKK